uniref:Putative ribonuclease H-like domain-containing protein n=1 Tax=Tanacetum cinerariifolium TaxID=118510 RepID=A0A6L2N6Z2_TANCI|nr:putative ribonuclease H-like domain-containing protein [Tanacetum cinerariifolium]
MTISWDLPKQILAAQIKALKLENLKKEDVGDLPFGKKAIGTKWVYRNKKDERGVVVRNKVRLVSQGHRQEEGIDYDEIFAHVVRIEAIRIFLAFASYMGFIVYQMNVKSAFLYGTIDEEVYVTQPLRFVDPKFPNKFYKVVKALYRLHQSLRAWYATLSTFLERSGYKRGAIDKTLFIKQDKKDIMLVRVYVDDIILAQQRSLGGMVTGKVNSGGVRLDEKIGFIREVCDLAGQQKTQITERKKQETSSEATSHVPINVKEKSKENGMQLTARAANSLLKPKRPTSRKISTTKAGTGSKSQRNKGQPTWKTYPSHGYKYIKDPIEIHHIKQREGESTKTFMERFKAESLHVNGAPKCMRISGFMHGITNLDLIKRLNENIPKSVDEMMSVTTAFLRREVTVANQSQKASQAWKHHEASHKPSFDKRLDFKNWHKSSKRHDRFRFLTKTLKEILAMETVKFKVPPSMTGPAKKQNKNNSCEFHRDKGYITDECIHLRKQIEEAVSDGQENPIVNEAKVEGHLIYCMYVDGGVCLRSIIRALLQYGPSKSQKPNDSSYNATLRSNISVACGLSFLKKIDRKLEVYVDDLVGKSHTEQEILKDYEETFQTLRKINMKLNLKKCTFGMEEGTSLGHVVNKKGIKACPDKDEVVTKLQSPRILKEVQSLNEKLASLHRFLSKAANGNRTRPKEELIIYLCAASDAVSVVLLTKRDSQKMSVYFVSRALQASKISYSSMEKLVLALEHALRMLRRYLQAHSIAVITDQPIKQILSRHENVRRMLKRKFKLDAFDITYKPRTSIRGQVLANFIAKRPDEDGSLVEVQVKEAVPDPWTLFTDGSS